MKIPKIEVARLLSSTSNIFASKGELLQFFRSPQYHPDEENESNHVQDFLEWRGIHDDILSSDTMGTFLKGKLFTPSKIPIKVQKQLEKERIELEEYIKGLDKFLE
jgi:hypothetical protein